MGSGPTSVINDPSKGLGSEMWPLKYVVNGNMRRKKRRVASFSTSNERDKYMINQTGNVKLVVFYHFLWVKDKESGPAKMNYCYAKGQNIFKTKVFLVK